MVKARAGELKNVVPLREHAYKRINSVLNTAQQNGRTLKDVLEDLRKDAPASEDAALLLRDLWDVLDVTETRISHCQPAGYQKMDRVLKRIMAHRFSGEEVLF